MDGLFMQTAAAVMQRDAPWLWKLIGSLLNADDKRRTIFNTESLSHPGEDLSHLSSSSERNLGDIGGLGEEDLPLSSEDLEELELLDSLQSHGPNTENVANQCNLLSLNIIDFIVTNCGYWQQIRVHLTAPMTMQRSQNFDVSWSFETGHCS
ncbi:hypothetical protein CVT24_002462 [Panaeolus cyanescens]|uniref:Uncharacterized protein n=1 Tax=Panaeolus cyanescens TaxID=181874 RepID=A0A409XBF1_9AGAR|nr:hypothetical protein CVT24_002462 [Panaeolus cyanescens]